MTDHRTEAEKWLAEAMNIWDEPRDYDDPPIDQLRIISRALVGIGHALLALTGQATIELQPPNYVGTGMRCDTTDDEGRRCTRGALHIMGAAGHHFDPEQP